MALSTDRRKKRRGKAPATRRTDGGGPATAGPSGDEPARARQQRNAGFAIAGAIVVWMVAQYLGAQGLLTTRVLFLFDFAALAVMVWALVVTYWVWRARRADRTR